MNDEFVILVADRNRHVREFLKRELSADGYRVQVARDGEEVLKRVAGDDPPDLLILDLEIPTAGGIAILERLHHRQPPLPVVIHTFLTEHINHLGWRESATLVEKSGDTDCLRATVCDMLEKFYPHRFETIRERCLQGKREGGRSE